MTRRPLPAALLPLVPLLVSCASPADVRAEHERNVDGLRDQLATADATLREELVVAEAWDHHFMGIPAAGWVPLLILAGLVVTTLLVTLGVAVYRQVDERRQNRHVLALKREETRKAAAQRGPCAVCGSVLTAESLRSIDPPEAVGRG